MAYNDQEISIQSGAPYFLYEFVTSNVTYRFTDYPTDIEWNSLTWSSFSIKHTEVKQSNELSKNSVTVSIPIGSAFSNLFIGWSPDSIVSFTLRRGHFGATDTLVYWKGRISSHKLKDKIVELVCESIFTSMRRPGIRARFQRNCRHALYAKGCNVDKSSFATTSNLTSFTGLDLVIPGAASQVSGYYNGGIIEFPDGSFRKIESHSGSSITINRASRFLTDMSQGYGRNYGLYYGGIAVILYPGCDRTVSTCKDKFNNLPNQGGFKWIPSKNPMAGSSIA